MLSIHCGEQRARLLHGDYCKSSFFREHKIFARFASGIKFANSFCPEFCGLIHVFLQNGFVSFFQDPKSAKISCNEKSKTEKIAKFYGNEYKVIYSISRIYTLSRLFACTH